MSSPLSKPAYTFTKNDTTVKILKQYDKDYPDMILLTMKDQPEVLLNLSCPYDLYHGTYVMVATFVKEFIKSEDETVRSLDYQVDPPLLNFIKTTNLFVLPSSIAELTNCCNNDTTYNTFIRLMNAMLYMDMAFDHQALSAIKARFFWFLLSMKMKHESSFPWLYSDFYTLAHYYDWVWILGTYQTFTSPVLNRANMRSLISKNSIGQDTTI